VHGLKYGRLPRIADDLAAAMLPLRPTTDGRSVLIPIPLAPKRLRERGYNQSEMLRARWPDSGGFLWLGRARPGAETPTQTALTPGTRLANVRAAFAVANVQCPMINDHWT